MDRSGIFLAIALGLLAHALIGYAPFPFGDDFAYGPLAEFRVDPTLFPRDEQLRLFENHAQVYAWVHWIGSVGPGVEPVFRLAVWMLAVVVVLVLYGLLKALKTPVAALPVLLGLGVVVDVGGMGRGDFGGLVSPFFHHHNVALALVLIALLACVRSRSWVAGALLGCAVYAQPMTAFHGALIVGFGALLWKPIDAVKMATTAIVVAIPAAIPILGSLAGAAGTDATIDLIRDAYRFRAPAHYDPTWPAISLATLYVLAGWIGIALLARHGQERVRIFIGAMVSLTALHLVTVVVYKSAIAEWVGFFILDANRSTPLLFVVGPALALAGVWHAPRDPLALIAGALLLAVVAINGTTQGLGLLALGAGMFALREVRWATVAVPAALVATLVLLFPPTPDPPPLTEPTITALERIREETPADALFVIPISLSAFRHYTQRSAYVDFKLFSVAQPDQAALTRARIDEVARPSPDHRSEAGWLAAHLWDEDQRKAATCEVMAETLKSVGADYYLRRLAAEEAPPVCPELPMPIQTETLALYGPSD